MAKADVLVDAVRSLQVMVPYDYPAFIGTLTNLVNQKVIPMKRINDAVRRILRVKFVLGLFENPLPDHSLVDQIGKQVMSAVVSFACGQR